MCSARRKWIEQRREYEVDGPAVWADICRCVDEICEQAAPQTEHGEYISVRVSVTPVVFDRLFTLFYTENVIHLRPARPGEAAGYLIQKRVQEREMRLRSRISSGRAVLRVVRLRGDDPRVSITALSVGKRRNRGSTRYVDEHSFYYPKYCGNPDCDGWVGGFRNLDRISCPHGCCSVMHAHCVTKHDVVCSSRPVQSIYSSAMSLEDFGKHMRYRRRGVG